MQDLETIPLLKDDIREKEQQLRKMKNEVEEKTALLLAARKAIRDYKDKLRVGSIVSLIETRPPVG